MVASIQTCLTYPGRHQELLPRLSQPIYVNKNPSKGEQDFIILSGKPRSYKQEGSIERYSVPNLHLPQPTAYKQNASCRHNIVTY